MLQDLGRKRYFLIVWGNCTIVVGLPGGCAKGHKAEYIVWEVFHLSQNWYLIYLAEKAEYIVWKVFHLYQFNLISNLSNRVWSVRAEYFIWNWLIFVLKFYPEVHLIWSRVCQEWLPRMTRLNILMLFGLRLEFLKHILKCSPLFPLRFLCCYYLLSHWQSSQ